MMVCNAQIVVPEGTKIRIRLESNITSATAEEGQTVDFIVADPVRIGDRLVFAEGSRATGTVTEAHEKRRMGRAGKLDFSIDRVKAIDDQWIPLRYTVTKKFGENHSVRTGIITAGVAAVFWPAAPVMLLMRGKDITINKGIAFDVYTNANCVVAGNGTTSVASNLGSTSPQPHPDGDSSNGLQASTATITITSTVQVADIEVDGTFVGSTPTTLQLSGGAHRIIVKTDGKLWERTLQVTGGSTVSLTAVLK